MPSHLNSLIFKSPDNCVIVVFLLPVMNQGLLSNGSVKIKLPESIPSSVPWCHCGARSRALEQVNDVWLGKSTYTYWGQFTSHSKKDITHDIPDVVPQASQLLLSSPGSSSFEECVSWEAALLLSKEGQSIINRLVGLSWKKYTQSKQLSVFFYVFPFH